MGKTATQFTTTTTTAAKGLPVPLTRQGAPTAQYTCLVIVDPKKLRGKKRVVSGQLDDQAILSAFNDPGSFTDLPGDESFLDIAVVANGGHIRVAFQLTDGSFIDTAAAELAICGGDADAQSKLYRPSWVAGDTGRRTARTLLQGGLGPAGTAQYVLGVVLRDGNKETRVYIDPKIENISA